MANTTGGRGCVLVPIYDGSISRFIVDSKSLEPLLNAGYNVKLIVEESRGDYYRKRFEPQGYGIIPIEKPQYAAWITRMQVIGVGAIPTKMMLHRHLRRAVEKKKYFLGFLRLGVWALGLFRPLRFVLQRLVLLHPIPQWAKNLIDREKPVLIFLPTVLSMVEVELLRYAKNKKIPVMGMVKTWDNITTKLALPIHPDWLIVHTPRVREEAIRVFHYPAEKISVVGLPQFDRYNDSKFYETREEFCRRAGLDPKIPFLLYCASGLWVSPDEPDILTRLNDDVERGVFGPLQVLVRMHPKYDCGADRLKNKKYLILERPGTYINKSLTSWEYEDQDLKHLVSSLRYAAVTSNTVSTMSIEAAFFDKPVLNIGFDLKPVSWVMSNARYYEREYYHPVVESGGVRVAYSYGQYVKDLKEYLAHPELDHEGRERIVREQLISREPVAADYLGRVLLGFARGERPLPSRA